MRSCYGGQAMDARAKTTCPTCGKSAEKSLGTKAFPFCSEACKLVDLGRWLSGDYRVPSAEIGLDDVPPLGDSGE